MLDFIKIKRLLDMTLTNFCDGARFRHRQWELIMNTIQEVIREERGN